MTAKKPKIFKVIKKGRGAEPVLPPDAKTIISSAVEAEPTRPTVTHSQTITFADQPTDYVANRTFIDEVTLGVPVQGELPGDTINLVSVDGEIKWRGQNRLEIDGKVVKGCSARVRTTNRKNLEIASSIKFLYGHNVAGLESLRDTAKHIIDRVLNQVSHKYSLEWKRPTRALVTLKEVALVRHLRCPAGITPAQVIEGFQTRCVANGVTTKHHTPNETYTGSSNPREYTVSFYWKGREMEAARGPASRHPRYSDLLTHVNDCVRVEIRVRKAALEKLGLAAVVNWKKRTADELMSSLLQRMPFLLVQPVKLTPTSNLPQLPPALQRAVALVMAGTDLRGAYSESSIRRLRQDARNKGFDLLTPPEPASAIHLDLATCDWVVSAAPEMEGVAGFSQYFDDSE